MTKKETGSDIDNEIVNIATVVAQLNSGQMSTNEQLLLELIVLLMKRLSKANEHISTLTKTASETHDLLGRVLNLLERNTNNG
jgi:hypothetical protein